MRIRSTKPEFWRSKTIADLAWDVRLVLKGLESYVDDNGVGKDDLALIACDVFPRDLSRDPRDTLARLSEAISTIEKHGIIVRYTLSGEDLLYVDRWKDIQRIDKPGRGRFPRPDGTLEYSEVVNRDSYGSPRETGASPPEVLAPGTGEQGNSGTGDQGTEEEELAPQAAAAKPKRRKQIPDSYMPERHVVDKIKAEFPSISPEILKAVHEDFCLYWRGQGKPMLDWDATWLRWIRKELPKHTRNGQPQQNGNVHKLRALAELEAEARAQENQDQKELA